MFLHTNLSPKWSLEVPADFSYYNRRWQVGLTLWTNMRCSYRTLGKTSDMHCSCCQLFTAGEAAKLNMVWSGLRRVLLDVLMLVDMSAHLDGDCALCMQILQPGNATFLTATQGLKRDLEHEIYQILVKLRCAPFLESYVATLKSEDRMGSERVMPLGLKAFSSVGGWSGSFHPLNNGIDFRYSNTIWSVYLSPVVVVRDVCTVTMAV